MTPMRAGSISSRCATSQSTSTRPTVLQFSMLTLMPTIGASYWLRAVDGEHGDAAVEPAVAVERDRHFFEVVHAGDDNR